VDADFVLQLNPHPDGNYYESISLIEPGGDIRWTARPDAGTSDDVWVEAHIEGDSILAHTWSCYIVRLSLASGGVLESVFTK
jgi:hypothetical protein